MAVDPWCVIVIRAWVERGEFRARMLVAGDQEGVAACGTEQEVGDQLTQWLGHLVDRRGADGAGSEGPSRRPPPRPL